MNKIEKEFLKICYEERIGEPAKTGLWKLIKPEIADSIKKQLKEDQLMDDIEVVQCMGDPDGIYLPTHILLRNGKEAKWYRQTK